MMYRALKDFEPYFKKYDIVTAIDVRKGYEIPPPSHRIHKYTYIKLKVPTSSNIEWFYIDNGWFEPVGPNPDEDYDESNYGESDV